MSDIRLGSDTQRVRIVFLIDVAMGRSMVCDKQSKRKAITLASTRILVCLSRFPQVKYKEKLKWNYMFYDSQQTDWSIRVKTSNFLELCCDHLETYSRDINAKLNASAGKPVSQVQTGACLQYEALGTAVHEFPWDAPSIVSPIRPCNRRKMKKKCEKEQLNVIFVFSDCPTSKTELETFCGLDHSKDSLSLDVVKQKQFPEALLSLVAKKNIKINFINCTGCTKQSESKDTMGCLLLSEIITTSLHGKVFDISQFVNPVCQRLLCDTASHDHTDASSHSQGSSTLNQGKSLSTGSHDHSGTGIQDKATSCTLTYPVITSLSTLMCHKDDTGSYHKEQNVLNLLEESGKLLCVLEVYPMLRDSSMSNLNDLYILDKDNGSTSQDGCTTLAEHTAGEVPVEGVMIGVIRITDVCLSWLHPSRAYTCFSIEHGGRGLKSLQNISLWLAANNCAVVVKINSHDLALFQPVTAFVSSLTFIKSEHISTIQTLETSKLNCITDSDSTESRAPLEAGLCVNLDRLFATSSEVSEESQQVFQVQSFHPGSLHLPAANCISSEFFAKLHQLAKLEESSNHGNSLSVFQESLLDTHHSNTLAQDDDQITATEMTVSEDVSQGVAISQFRSTYQRCIESGQTEDELFVSITGAINKLEDSLSMDKLLEFLEQEILLKHAALRVKHETMTPGNDAEKRKINEYQLQVLLYLEVYKRAQRDHVGVAEQLVLLLRGISLVADPQFLGHYLTDVLLTNYLDSCSEVIRLLYEELMLPLPAEIASPTLDTSHATSDGESPFCAVKKRPLVTTAAAAEDSSSRKLKRYKSFHGFPVAKRQIAVVKDSKKSKKDVKQCSSRSVALTNRASSPPPARRTNKGEKNVRRSLFTRSKSVANVTSSQPGSIIGDLQGPSHRGVKLNNNFCVQETPLKKQVPNYQQFKLQRARSKLGTECHPEIDSIKESPFRLPIPHIPGSTSGLLQNNSSQGVIGSSSGEEDEGNDALMSLYLTGEHDIATSSLLDIQTDSMAAFALSTPPKEAQLNFLNIIDKLH
ncbi:treslin-like isoform X2 [Dysidea avara]|uniref:treslin-like isoform X2 n=1 Tax=Dysidea avara TaxID=196820 RepID=UPI0033263062